MKIAVLFTFVVLLFVAFLQPASGCKCETFITNAKKAPKLLKQLGLHVNSDIMKMGPKAICEQFSKDTIDLIKEKASC